MGLSKFCFREGQEGAALEEPILHLVVAVVPWWWPVGSMSFVFRGSRADIEAGGFPQFTPERRAMVSATPCISAEMILSAFQPRLDSLF